MKKYSLPRVMCKYTPVNASDVNVVLLFFFSSKKELLILIASVLQMS